MINFSEQTEGTTKMIPVRELPKKLESSTTQVYEYLKTAKIKPKKEGKTSYISDSEFNILIDIKKHLASGGTLNNFIQTTPTELVKESPIQPLIDNSLIEFAKIITNKPLTDIEQLEKKYSFLDKIYLTGIILSTSEIEKIIKIKPRGKEFKRGSYLFIKSGKIGNQAGWRVERATQTQKDI